MRQDSWVQAIGLKLMVWVGMALTMTQCTAKPTPQIHAAQPQPAGPTFAEYGWPHDGAPVAQLHLLTIPPSYPINIALSDPLKTVAEFAAEQDAWAVLNGGFFDPNNTQTTSFVTRAGTLVADPRENLRLVNNPDLAIYMAQILNRSEFRRYDCPGGIRYDITVHDAPPDCTIHSALGAGPQLLPMDTSQAEGFTDYVDGVLVRDAIGSQRRNARSAIGIKADGTVIWLMVGQVTSTGGMTLAELADLMATLGVQKALNLDGGSSSSMYLADAGQGFYGRLTGAGDAIVRPVKSVLWLSPPEAN